MSRRSVQLLVPCLLLGAVAGCRSADQEALALAQETKAHLAEREAKLSRYRFAARAEQADEPPVGFDFAYRAPGRMRGRLFAPQSRVLSFDGQAVYEVIPGERRFRRYTLPTDRAELATRVSALFTPFLPEGYRTPLLPWRVVRAIRVAHPRAKEAVALRADIQDDRGQPLSVLYTLRWPTGDFLAKRLEGSGGAVDLRMEEEQCEAKLGLCLPTKLGQWHNGQRVGTTLVHELELFGGPAAEDFTLEAPGGYESTEQAL
jgi:hypothetical protein